MAGVDTRRSRVASFKKRQCVIKGTQNAWLYDESIYFQ
jgi:hypothetical protein